MSKYGVKMNKSDISQYVSGKVEPGQDKLVILGMALNVNESWLMGFDVPSSRDFANSKSDTALTLKEEYIINLYRQLNPDGQNKIEVYARDLVASHLYSNEPRPFDLKEWLNLMAADDLQTVAAHEREDIEVTDEMRQHDDDIMDDENF